jgi:uncharacterized surface protein with fasciclin (FAS1) repeats
VKVKIPKKVVVIFCLVLLLSLIAWLTSLALDPKNQEYNGIHMKKIYTLASNIDLSPTTTKFAQALNDAGYASLLDSSTAYTVFVPSDDAFKNLPDDTSEAIYGLADTSVESAVISYHIIPGIFKFDDLKDGMKVQTLEGETLSFKKQGESVLINGYSAVTMRDIVVSNGVIHVVDNFLIPPSIVK